jgi:hypothetical protein
MPFGGDCVARHVRTKDTFLNFSESSSSPCSPMKSRQSTDRNRDGCLGAIAPADEDISGYRYQDPVPTPGSVAINDNKKHKEQGVW